jgi:anti-sigma factor RsiW
MIPGARCVERCSEEPRYANSTGAHVDGAEECRKEAEKCERLGGLARSIATRQLMAVAAFQWRKLAEKAEERDPASSFVWPGRRPP